MNFFRKVFLFAAFTSPIVLAQKAPTIADAQKAYVAGKWKEAATAFESVCPGQPKDEQVSCNLWEILALSQIGDGKSFKTAGTKLDSLIGSTSPMHANYADLVMTRAQFLLYLGKYDKAAEELIHAIETSQSAHKLGVQKVWAAVLSRAKNPELSERCEELKHTDSAAVASPNPRDKSPQPTQQTATPPAKEAPSAEKPLAQPAEKPQAPSGEGTEPPKAKEQPTAIAAEPAVKPEGLSQPSAPRQSAVPAPAAKQEPAAETKAKSTEEYWTLQLGAFGMKNNATLLVSNLKKQKIQSTIEESPREERTLYIVQTGRFNTKEEALDYGEKALTPLKVEFQPLFKK